MHGNVVALVLAAGKGTRMRNGLPKVLHPLAGWPLIGHVLAVAHAVAERPAIVVLSPNMEDVQAVVEARSPGSPVAIQDPPLGTGHAVGAARALLPEQGEVIVLYGDTPLVSVATLEGLLAARRAVDAAVAVLGFAPPDPSGYGRLRFVGEDLAELVEERHADPELRRTGLCNSGVMAFDAARLGALLDGLRLRPEKGEYYLTDVVALAHASGWRCTATSGDWIEGLGVNSQSQLAEVERHFQQRARSALLDAGVIMTAPETVYLAADTVIAPGAVIEPYVLIGPGVVIGERAVVHGFSHLEGAKVAGGASVGPFARLRPGTELGKAARVGNFVELKNARLAEGAKANHLSYLGDATIGAAANVGAGTITCNYDGFAKHRTEIEAGAFIGSNSALVAPVRVGRGAIVAAGSTITTDVPDDALAFGRATQRNLAGRAERLRRRLAMRKSGNSE